MSTPTSMFTLAFIKEKWSHSGFQKHFQNLGWMFFARLGSMAISFIATAYIARTLGATNYGQLSYAVSFVGLFSFLASLGIDQILYRDLIRYPEKRDVYMGSAVGVKLMASIATMLICSGFALFFSPMDVSFFLILLISFSFIFNSFQCISYEFLADTKTKYTSILSLAIVLILNALKLVFIFNGFGVIYLAGVILLEPILYSIGYIYLRTKNYGSIRQWRYDKKIALDILKNSFPLIFASAFFAIYARIDQVMIKNMIDTESVGLYDSAVRISELWYFIPHLVVAALFPAIVNAKKASEDLYYKRVRNLFILIMSISALTALPTAILSKHIIGIVFGAGFIGAVGVLKIYIWSNIGSALNLLTQQMLIAENYTKTISITAFLGMITNVGLNIIFIPKFGMEGAAYASLISYVIPFLSLLLFKKTRGFLIKICTAR